MNTLLSLLRSLRRDRQGAAMMEFALLAPVMALMLLGLMDLGYQAYARALLEGAMQKAGRDSGIEGADATLIDNKVRSDFRRVAKTATLEFERRSYANFGVMRPERFTDTNLNGVRDPFECYDDVNGNQQWDADPGLSGQGGASDVTLYTVRAQLPRMFPMASLMGWPKQMEISANTLLKNQPYASQSVPTVVTRCN